MWSAAIQTMVVGVLLAGSLSADPIAPDKEELRPGCVTCHSSTAIERYGSEQRLYVPADLLRGTAHEGMSCSCHPALTAVIHEDPQGELRATRASCANCHRAEAMEYLKGTHVRSGPAAAAPTDGTPATVGSRCILCHGAHEVRLAGFLPLSEEPQRPAPGVDLVFAIAGAMASVAAVGLAMTRMRRRRALRPAPAGRREFLELMGVGLAGLAVDAAMPVRMANAAEGLADRHAADPALLIDVTRCVGCASCVAACKLENGLRWRADQPWEGSEARLASSNWSIVRDVDPGDERIAHVKRQCMHCLDPACASVCPVKAMRKEALGPVTYDRDLCIGCRYCLMACPFGVPTFEWDRSIGEVSKCDMCFDRVSEGLLPACVEACPVQGIAFGPREQMLDEARRRIADDPDRYVPEVYGEREAGGTSALYLSDVPFSALGLPEDVPERPLPEYTWELSRLVPPFAAGLGVLLVAAHLRRRRIAGAEAHVPEGLALAELPATVVSTEDRGDGGPHIGDRELEEAGL